MIDNILLIGGKGYIGNHLANLFSKKKIRVTVIDNSLYGNNFFSKPKNNFYKTYINKDIRKLKENFIKNFNIVIFLAALSNNPITKRNQNLAYKITEKYTMRVAKICKKYNLKFIFPSSCSVYGYQKSSKKVNEKSSINPLTFYSKNKATMEKKLLNIADKNFKPIIFRPATVFGFSEVMRFDLVINMFVGMAITNKTILLNSDGTAYRPFVDLDTLCNCFLKACRINNKKPLVVNIGYNKFNLKIIDIAKIISKLTKSNIQFLNSSSNNNNLFKDDLIKNNKDMRSYNVNFDYAETIFNLKENINIESKIKVLIKNLKKYKNLKLKIKNKKFYRLEQLQFRIANKLVTEHDLVVK